MAKCIVKLDYAGWRKGDHIEAEGDRLQELVSRGIVEEITQEIIPKFYVRGPNGGFLEYKGVKK